MSERVLFVDGSAGAAGDMILGALVDLGVPFARLRRALLTLPVEGFTLRSRRVRRAGLAARKIDVRVRDDSGGRRFADVRRIVRGAALDAGVRDRALRIFRRLYEAEARVHGGSPERIHLHEAGALDAIVDIVGAAFALAELDVGRIVVSPLTTGSGTIRCAHGLYPVPGPATLELLRGCPAQAGPIEVERLTPTGAAILTTVADAWGPLPPLRPLEIGYGAGSREIDDTPNALRMVLGEAESELIDAAVDPAREIAVIECAVDDATPQALAYAAERLLELGALDVQTAPVVMKKGRAGHALTVLARPAELDRLAGAVLAETSTLGLRIRRERRMELERSTRRVRTPFGSVRVKLGRLDGRLVQIWPEYEDCAMLARRGNVPLTEVQRAALEACRAGND